MSASRLASAVRRAPLRSSSLQRLLPAMAATSSIPQAPWVSAVTSAQHKTRRIPQVIAHRGYKAKWPENTIEAMRAAVEAGAQGIETDVHLSSDGVVVLSHDPTLKRCYGREDKISDVSWAELSTLKTIKAPHLSMPRLQDVLAWLSEPGNKDTWLLLDIKLDDDADTLLKAIADTLDSVPSSSSSWNQRIVLGCWNATFLKAARKHLPTFPVVHISFSLGYTQHFLPQPNMGANMLMRRLVGPRGPSFMRSVDGPLLVWTVNAPESMEWCLANNLREEENGQGLIDGVITDDPALYVAVCKRWEDQQDGIVALPPKPSFAQIITNSLRGVASYVWVESMCKLFFLVRRFWNGKFDYLAKGEVL